MCGAPNAPGLQGVVHPPSPFVTCDKSGVFEHPEVVGEQVEGKLEVLLQLAHTAGAMLQVLQDPQAVFIAEDFEVLLECFNGRCFNHD